MLSMHSYMGLEFFLHSGKFHAINFTWLFYTGWHQIKHQPNNPVQAESTLTKANIVKPVCKKM